jgi:Zn-dependent peptidase ImmA (M78 family)
MAMPNESSTEIIRSFSQTAPVDVYGIAEALGIDCRDETLDGNASGKIEKHWFFDTYTIAVNKAHPITRRRFTVAHEIGHFVLHRDQIGDGIEDDAMYRSGQSSRVEREANAFAASILMPAPLVVFAFEQDGLTSSTSLAKRFVVSSEVAAIRMRELRLG